MIFRKDLMVETCKKLEDYDNNNGSSLYSIKLVDDEGDFIRVLYDASLDAGADYYCTFWVGDYKKGETWLKGYRLKSVRKIQ